MRAIFIKTFVGVLLSLCLIGGFGAAAHAQSNETLQATLDATHPSNPTLTLTNTSNTACQVADTTLGTVAISELRQAGKTVEPQYMEASFDESLATILEEELRTLKPNESLTIKLRSFPVDGGYSLESISWSADAGAYGLRYPVAADEPMDIALTYEVPIETKGAPMCGPASIALPSQTGSLPFLFWLGIGIAVIIIIFIILWLLRKKIISKKHAAVGVILLFSVVGLQWQPPRAFAEAEVPESLAGPWADCMATLEANRDITGPILDVINNPDIRVEIVPDERSDALRYSDTHYRIYWDTREDTAYGGGGTLVPRDPCSGLYHEMYHVFDMHNGTYSRAPCGSSGIDTKEVMATRAQNVLRERLGLPPRTHYGHQPLPEGECHNNQDDADRCQSGNCGESTGDPHLTTFDGLRYSFQAAGEFTLVYDKTDNFEIQVRQEPWPNSRRVAITTAAALRLGDDRLEFRQQSNRLVLLINGKEHEIKDMPLDNATLRTHSSSNTMTVQLPDNTKVTIQTLGSFGMKVLVDPSEKRQQQLEGLLGNFDGAKEKDLQLRGNNTTVEPEFSQLYPRFADSWRIDANASLFTYQQGQSTATFTDRSLPDKAAHSNNTPNRVAAEQFCRNLGVSDEVSLQNCIVDIGYTSRPQFGQAALENQQLAAAKTGTTAVEVNVPEPGKAASHAFKAKKGQRVFVVATTNMPDQCSPLRLVDPQGKVLNAQCITNGKGLITSGILANSGTYRLELDPTNKHTGSISAQITLSRDITQPITIDSSAKTVNLARPGQVAHFPFKGHRGQNIKIHIDTTLPGQCGGITLQASDDKSIASACLSNGHATFSDSITLPANDTYTLTINPSDAGTGNITLHITSQ